jgi:hypothetical protein
VELDNETLFSVWQHAGGDEQPYWIVVGGFWNPFPSVPVAVDDELIAVETSGKTAESLPLARLMSPKTSLNLHLCRLHS